MSDLQRHAPLVPPDLLDPPWRRDSRGMYRDLAALVLDRHLRRLTRMRQPIDLRIAVILRRVADSSGYLALGYARFADYVTERLGLPLRRAHTLVALARSLHHLPRVTAAFESGQVTLSQVQLLLRVATPETESDWLSRCAVLTVRRLDLEVRAAATAGEATTPDADASPRGPTDGSPDDPMDGPPDGPPDQGLSDRSGRTPPIDDDATTDGEYISFTASPTLRARWELALDLARRVSGAGDPTWQCAEFIAAEYLSGVSDLEEHLAAMSESRGDDSDACTPSDRSGPTAPMADPNGVELFEAVLAGLEAEIPQEPGSEGPVARTAGTSGESRVPQRDVGWAMLPEDLRDHPGDSDRERDARLRDLVRVRQEVTWNLGRLVRIFVDRRFHRELGFMSFARYCRERLGLGTRRVWNLVALDRRLFLLPRTTAAYRCGEVSWVRASAIARVATESTEARWLHLARSVTVRRLQEEAALAESLESRTGHAPVPPGIDDDGRVQMSSPRAVPAPPQTGRHDTGSSTLVRFWAPRGVASLWHEALAIARRSATGPPTDGECVALIVEGFIGAWSLRADAEWLRRYRVFERDGWRCRVPGCTSRGNLQAHHVIFRSQGGSDDDANLVVLCATHHLQGIHRGRLRCHALTDGLLAWELAPDPEGRPLAAYVEDVEWSAARVAFQSLAGSGFVDTTAPPARG